MADHYDVILNDRCFLERQEFEDRPIEGVRYAGVTTRAVGSESLIVVQVDIKKYGVWLCAVLPRRYPEEKPRLEFVNNIPHHPLVNPVSGEICCVWPTKDEQWSPSVKIRDVVTPIMDMLEAAEIPIVTKSRKELKDGRTERFPLSPREFHHFLGEGVNFVADLKHRLRCQAKYLGMEKQKDPHFGITGEPLATRQMMAELDEYLVSRRFRRTVTYRRPIANDDKDELQDVAGASIKRSYRYSSDVFRSLAALPSSCTRSECKFPAPPSPFHAQFDASFDNSVAMRSASSVLHHHQPEAPMCTSRFSTDEITCTEPLYDESVDEAMAEFMIPPSYDDKFGAANLIDFGNEQSDNATANDEHGLVETSAIAGPDQPEIDETDQIGIRPVSPDFLDHEFITQSETNEIAMSTEDSDLEEQFNSSLMAAIAEESRQAAAAVSSSIDDYVELELPLSLKAIALADLSDDDVDKIIKQTKKCILEITPMYYRIVLALNRRVDIMERKLKELCDRIPLAIMETRMAKNDFARRRQELVRGQQEMERFRCAMCMRRLVNTALTCGHVLCGQCVGALRATGNRCPLCHQMSDHVLQLY